jgi:hypothetical protein
MQRLEVSGAVRHIYIYVIRRRRVKKINLEPHFKAVEKGSEWEKRGCSGLRKCNLAKIMWRSKSEQFHL